MQPVFKFEQTSSDAIKAAAQRMQEHSPFTGAADFHLCIPDGVPPAALQRLAAEPRVTGSFVKWEIFGDELRLLCTLDALGALGSAPSCHVGSVAGVDPALRLDFIAAVGEAFPLTAESTFEASLVVTPAPKATLDARAPPFMSRGQGAGAKAKARAEAKAALEQRLSTLADEVAGYRRRVVVVQDKKKQQQQQQKERQAAAALRRKHKGEGGQEGGAGPAPMDVSTGATGRGKAIRKNRQRGRGRRAVPTRPGA